MSHVTRRIQCSTARRNQGPVQQCLATCNFGWIHHPTCYFTQKERHAWMSSGIFQGLNCSKSSTLSKVSKYIIHKTDLEMSKLWLTRPRERNCWTRTTSRIEKQRWKIIGCLVIFWIAGIYFRQYIPFSIGGSHEVRDIDLDFEDTLINGGSSPFDENGFLGAMKASRYCNAHNWKAFPKRDSRRKICM